MYFIEILIVVFIGLVLGSFSTALIYRVPRKLSWAYVRSSCTTCKSNLGAADLIPVISWCVFKGKCRYCSNKISCKYPIIELASVFLCLAVYFVFGVSAQSLFLILAVPILISLFVIDTEHMILPNQLVFILFVMGAARLAYDFTYSGGGNTYNYIIGAVVYLFFAWGLGALFTKILKKDALGFGDVKFFGVAGLWLGVFAFPNFLILSGVVGVLFAICWRKIAKSELFPFGPALIMSLYILLLLQ